MGGEPAEPSSRPGPVTVNLLVLEAAARFDPEETEGTEGTEADQRAGLYVNLDLHQLPSTLGKASAVPLDACLDRGDAEELDAALSALAEQQAADGSPDDLDVRRAKALGHLARLENHRHTVTADTVRDWCATDGNLDLDHTSKYVPPDQGGPPGQTSTDNLAPLCRTHHRTKPHPSPAGDAWHYRRLTPGTWLWTSPHHRRYLVHPDGTTTI